MWSWSLCDSDFTIYSWSLATRSLPFVMKGVGRHWNQSNQTIKAKDTPSTHFELVQAIVNTLARDSHVTSPALVSEWSKELDSFEIRAIGSSRPKKGHRTHFNYCKLQWISTSSTHDNHITSPALVSEWWKKALESEQLGHQGQR